MENEALVTWPDLAIQSYARDFLAVEGWRFTPHGHHQQQEITDPQLMMSAELLVECQSVISGNSLTTSRTCPRLETDTRAYFSGVTILISLPTATKIFNWLSTYLLFPILLNRHISVSFCLQEFSGPSHSLLTQIQDFLVLERHNITLISCESSLSLRSH